MADSVPYTRKPMTGMPGWEFDGQDFWLNGSYVGRLNVESGSDSKFRWQITQRYGQTLFDAHEDAMKRQNGQ